MSTLLLVWLLFAPHGCWGSSLSYPIAMVLPLLPLYHWMIFCLMKLPGSLPFPSDGHLAGFWCGVPPQPDSRFRASTGTGELLECLGLGRTAHPWHCQRATQLLKSNASRAQSPRCPTCHLPQLSLPKTEPFRTRPCWPPAPPTQLRPLCLVFPLSGMLSHSSS